jgi:hypothetical protein
MYRYLSIDIDGWDFDPQNPEACKPSVDRCLELFFSPEDREVKCEKCEVGRIATQTMTILSQPKAMLLHLKRFVMVETMATDDANGASSSTGLEMCFKKNKVCEPTKRVAPFYGECDCMELPLILTLVDAHGLFSTGSSRIEQAFVTGQVPSPDW